MKTNPLAISYKQHHKFTFTQHTVLNDEPSLFSSSLSSFFSLCECIQFSHIYRNIRLPDCRFAASRRGGNLTISGLRLHVALDVGYYGSTAARRCCSPSSRPEAALQHIRNTSKELLAPSLLETWDRLARKVFFLRTSIFPINHRYFRTQHFANYSYSSNN